MYARSSHGRSPNGSHYHHEPGTEQNTSLKRSISPRPGSRLRNSRSPSTEYRANERIGRESKSRSRSRSRSRTFSRSRSRSRGRTRSRSQSLRLYRERSGSRSQTPPSPLPRSSKIVIEKLTKNVTEAHLLEIFGGFGAIQSLDLPMNNAFMTNRGTAYILYHDPADAEAAIAHMHEAQLDGVVLNVSIVLPKRAFSRSPPPQTARGGGRPRHGRGQPSDSRPSHSSPYSRRSPGPRRFGRARPMERHDLYRPRSVSQSRSRSPLRSRSLSSRSPSMSPPRRRNRVRDDSPRRRRRRSPSYSSYDYSSRSRSRSLSRTRVRNRYGPRR